MHEALYNDMDDAVEDIFRIISTEIDDCPYAIFGHSMGGSIAYNVAQMIQRNDLPLPAHGFFSARKAPHLSRDYDKQCHLMSDDEFRAELIDLGGTPPEFFDHPELMQLFLPLLKNDFRITETERTDGPINPLDIDISVFFGKEDDFTGEECNGWRLHTRRECNIQFFEGGHFFLHNETGRIAGAINAVLNRELERIGERH